MFQQYPCYSDLTTKSPKITNAEQKNKLTIPLYVHRALGG